MSQAGGRAIAYKVLVSHDGGLWTGNAVSSQPGRESYVSWLHLESRGERGREFGGPERRLCRSRGQWELAAESTTACRFRLSLSEHEARPPRGGVG